jgi:SpoVK/Ycf46/Vps4 family AAA+-type ATPase
VVLIAATNHEKEIDPAALRRFQKKIYIGPPDHKARVSILQGILEK